MSEETQLGHLQHTKTRPIQSQHSYHPSCHVPTPDYHNEHPDYPCSNVPVVCIRLCMVNFSIILSKHHPQRTCAQNRHHDPASPPPSGADAAASHLPQYAPINPMISMNDMLGKISRAIGWRTVTSFTDLNASKILIVVRTMLSSDIVLRLTSVMRPFCSGPAASLSQSRLALSTVLLSVSVASRGTMAASFAVAPHTSTALSPVPDTSQCMFTDCLSPVLTGKLFDSKILHEWPANPVYE